ncbi:hypothetical protein F4811DRAFT_569355 [Daldinia bambusicola]|nr:hypothetical protein F4811DRAFT_569355 [Daldinia bambusicola]
MNIMASQVRPRFIERDSTPRISGPMSRLLNNDERSRDMQLLSRRRDRSTSSSDSPSHRPLLPPPPPPSSLTPERIYIEDREFDEDIPLSHLHHADVNGFWNPCDTDLTVHLKLSAQEDIDESLEEFCRMWRMGDFVSAKRFFAENLQDHLDEPDILIEYAEMLLEQGDYNSLSRIMVDTRFNRIISNARDDSDGEMLYQYWKIMHGFTTTHTITADPTGLDLSYNMTIDEIDPQRELYSSLLRQGRIWDLYDITQSRMMDSAIDVTKDWSDDPDIRKRIECLIKDWSSTVHGYNTSTTLALLGILASYAQKLTIGVGMGAILLKGKSEGLLEYIVDQSTSLAISVMENDPKSMRSRSFMMWILAKSHNAFPNQLQLRLKHLESSPGVTTVRYSHPLPSYIPAEAENPGWGVDKEIPELEAPVRMVVKSSRALGDYRTEAMSLQWLIQSSAKPAQELEELGSLQKEIQGDIFSYANTLLTRYLVCETEASKNSLKREISEILSIEPYDFGLSFRQVWALRMLQHTLESNKALAQKYLEEADLVYKRLGENDQREIDERLHIEQRLLPHTDTSQAPGFSEEQLQSEEDRLILEHEILKAKRKHLKIQQDDQVPDNQSTSDFKIIASPHILEGKKMTISFQDVENPSEKHEMSYQLNTSEAVIKGPEIFDGYQIEPQGSGKEMKAVKINQDTSLDMREQRHGIHQYQQTVTDGELTEGRALAGSKHSGRYSGVQDSIQDEPLEKLNEVRRILYLLERELVKATENSSSERGDEIANQRKFLRTAIEDRRKEIQTIEQQIKAEEPVPFTRNESSTSTSTNSGAVAPHGEHDRTAAKNRRLERQRETTPQEDESDHWPLEISDDDVPISKEVKEKKKKQERQSTRSELRGRSQTPESDASVSSAERTSNDQPRQASE